MGNCEYSVLANLSRRDLRGDSEIHRRSIDAATPPVRMHLESRAVGRRPGSRHRHLRPTEG